ncbi:hypothetical protein UY3_09777 [Chelonia mydas]|uniref:Uncharacterized protein n=1 Tax=Chelonia mydas TaxID=8469 RepID=M7BBW0_CHEMY|nr:hypothetical protein UY3_09777 [Chelonia mydas]
MLRGVRQVQRSSYFKKGRECEEALSVPAGGQLPGSTNHGPRKRSPLSLRPCCVSAGRSGPRMKRRKTGAPLEPEDDQKIPHQLLPQRNQRHQRLLRASRSQEFCWRRNFGLEPAMAPYIVRTMSKMSGAKACKQSQTSSTDRVQQKCLTSYPCDICLGSLCFRQYL